MKELDPKMREVLRGRILELLAPWKTFPGASDNEIRQFEAMTGRPIDPVLDVFYRTTNGAVIGDNSCFAYRIRPIQQMVRTRIEIFGRDDKEFGPDHWYGFCQMEDGDFVSVVLDEKVCVTGFYDSWHEEIPGPAHNNLLCESLLEFLEKCCQSPSRTFWLGGAGEA